LNHLFRSSQISALVMPTLPVHDNMHLLESIFTERDTVVKATIRKPGQIEATFSPG